MSHGCWLHPNPDHEQRRCKRDAGRRVARRSKCITGCHPRHSEQQCTYQVGIVRPRQLQVQPDAMRHAAVMANTGLNPFAAIFRTQGVLLYA